jgi:hypothetical protein
MSKAKRLPNKNQPNRSVNEALVGTRVGELEIIRYFTKIPTFSSKHRGYFECRCKCGNIFEARCDLIKGKVQTHCGCHEHNAKYQYKCKECGKDRDPKYEWSLCDACRKKKATNKARKDKGRPLYIAPRKPGEYIPDPNIVYQDSRPCVICDQPFVPMMEKNIRCTTCKPIAGLVYSKVTCAHRSHKRTPLTKENLNAITRRYVRATECIYCGIQFSAENGKSLDHIIPVWLGGNNENSNINVCCLTCNKMKGGLILDDWLTRCAQVSIRAAKALPPI